MKRSMLIVLFAGFMAIGLSGCLGNNSFRTKKTDFTDSGPQKPKTPKGGEGQDGESGGNAGGSGSGDKANTGDDQVSNEIVQRTPLVLTSIDLGDFQIDNDLSKIVANVDIISDEGTTNLVANKSLIKLQKGLQSYDLSLKPIEIADLSQIIQTLDLWQGSEPVLEIEIGVHRQDNIDSDLTDPGTFARLTLISIKVADLMSEEDGLTLSNTNNLDAKIQIQAQESQKINTGILSQEKSLTCYGFSQVGDDSSTEDSIIATLDGNSFKITNGDDFLDYSDERVVRFTNHTLMNNDNELLTSGNNVTVGEMESIQISKAECNVDGLNLDTNPITAPIVNDTNYTLSAELIKIIDGKQAVAESVQACCRTLK